MEPAFKKSCHYLMQFTGKDNPFTYTLTGLIFSVVFCLAVFITWRCTWEAKDVQEDPDADPSLPSLR